MAIINLFFIPAVAVYLLYKLTHRPLKFDLEFVLIYMTHCSVIAVITKVILFCVKYLFDFQHTEVSSAYYAAAALAVSLVAPFVVKSCHATNKEN